METRRGLVRTIFNRCTETHMSPTIIILYLLLLCFHFPVCFTRDTITLNETISGQHGETLISAGERFELGFFRMNSSTSRYVGIWYYRSNPKIIVWVANREKPLSDDTGVFALDKDGNLKVLDGNKKAYWSTELPGWVSFKGTVRLLDSGNLVLSKEDERSGSLRVIWQSFDEPTDTFLPGMKMNENLKLISWKNAGDPAPGNFWFQQDEHEENQYSIKKEKSTVYWKSGVWGKFITSDVFLVISSMLSNSTGSTINMKNLFRNNSTSSDIIRSSILNKNNSRLVMNSGGPLQYFTRGSESVPWELLWSEPKDKCSMYKPCGEFASCNIEKTPLCECLPGFKPVSPDSWNPEDQWEDCQRETPLCKNHHKRGYFLGFNVTKVGEPDNQFETGNKVECAEDCLKDCTCQAYAYEEPKSRDQKAKCWHWTDSLNNIQQGDIGDGREIQLHLQHTVIDGVHTLSDGVLHGKKTNSTWIVVATTIATVIVLACTIAYIYIRKREVKTQGDRESTLALHLHDSQKNVQDLIDSGQLKEEDKKGIDLPFFDLKSILAATNSFSDENILGKGGFGPVYKGRFPGGQEIAVKRLSNVSGQGLDEFKNEIVLIARLQHRNLVRLLGYCWEGDEKILLYEYMPNKSLDFFIFDRKLSMLLDWEMRFNIILGIARGLLYLHQDSRLRIIHRDLKTSNILLDQEMNPKISDFGLARIFEGNQTEGTTARVVGTYGYMSPEYALEGFFSVKSDVFSFGVVVLEIISGRRNTGFYNSVEALSLLGYAWKLWQEDKALDIMDQQLRASSKTNEILKCINIGLFCVQEDSNDRPTMSNVVVMLSSETMALPTPKQPAFILRRGPSSTASSSSKPESNTQLTVTLDGR